jgi:hypothetical protein
VVRLDPDFAGLSIMVIDGPFGCIDPHGSTDLHVLGHVTETVHYANVGLTPEVPAMLRGWLGRGPELSKSSYTRMDRIRCALSRFVPAVNEADYVGSMLTIRTVLPNLERTDARPTLVDRLDDQVIRVFSGKIGTAVSAARQVTALLQDMAQTRKVA